MQGYLLGMHPSLHEQWQQWQQCLKQGTSDRIAAITAVAVGHTIYGNDMLAKLPSLQMCWFHMCCGATPCWHHRFELLAKNEMSKLEHEGDSGFLLLQNAMYVPVEGDSGRLLICQCLICLALLRV